MLRRVNAGLFEAPEGARIQLVARSQGNTGVEAARFQYGAEVLPAETIDGLPGCTFDVAGFSDLLEVGVVFDPAAPGTARYDLFEFENGVRSSLDLFVRHSDSSPLIFFTIDPVGVLATAGAAAARGGAMSAPAAPPPPRAVTRTAVKRAKKAAPKAAKRPAKAATKKKPARKAARKARAPKKASAPRKTASRRKTSRKRAK